MKKGYLTLLVLLMFAMVVAYFVSLQQSDQPTPEQHVLEEYGALPATVLDIQVAV